MTADLHITCIMPVRDGAAFIGNALDSIVRQSRPVERIIVIDDGSCDDSAAVARAHPAAAKVISIAPSGPGAARNAGLAQCNRGLVAFLDADDLWHPDKILLQLECLARRPETGICLSAFDNIADPPLLPGVTDWRSTQLGVDRRTPLLSAALVRSAACARVGGFDTSLYPFGEDSDWFLRCRAAGIATARLDQVLVQRRLHLGNLTRRFDNNARADTAFAVITEHLARKRLAQPPQLQPAGSQ
jgi:glycosyltransferase involved in cell wall biosynthesis